MDKYTFQIVIQDSYNKPPKTTLVIDSQAFQMELLNRTGTGPYTYTFSKKLSLENGDYIYHYEVGNVWTLLISDDYFLNVSFMPKTTDLTIYAGNSKLDAWNIRLTDNILPDTAEISFESNSLISNSIVQVVMNADRMRRYSFRIMSIQNTEKGYQYSAVSSANLNKTISTSVTAIKSIDLAKSILNAPVHGDLPEYIYLQQYENTTISNILQKLLIVNGARGYERNGRFFFKRDNDAKLKLTRFDKTVKWIEDRKKIKNDIKEFYSIKQYPAVANSLTSYDAANWSGTVANALMTTNGLLSPNGNLYILKGNGTITRDVDFKITDFDHFTVTWSPPSSETLTIKLLTDSSNYLSYARSFAGPQGAGFILTSTNQSDEVVKTLTFTSKLIHSVQGKTSDTCSAKVILKLSSSVVSETEWKNTVNNEFTFTFDNQETDTIEIHFKNLYVINTTYGVNCQNLSITEYAQVASGSQTSYQTTWRNQIDDLNFPYVGDKAGGNKGTVIHFSISNLQLFSVPPLQAGESYNVYGNLIIPTHSADGVGSPFYNTQIYLPINISITKGKAVASLSYDYTVSNYYETFNAGEKCHFYAQVLKVKTDVKTSYVWKYLNYTWQSSYPMWDSADIPISQFSKTGAPVNIAQIELTATGDNYYDNIYLYASKPNAYYVEVEDENSINKYGRRFDLRKLDGWTSKESATLFATKYLDIFKKPSFDYRKEVPIKTPIELGDSVDCDGNSLYVYRILYDWESGRKTIYVGINVRELVERLKQMAQKIDNLEKNIM